MEYVMLIKNNKENNNVYLIKGQNTIKLFPIVLQLIWVVFALTLVTLG